MTIDHIRRARPYLENLRNDPRTRKMFDGWVAQATVLAAQRVRVEGEADARRLAHEAAREAIALAMSFVLDNDGELQAVMAERDNLLEAALKTSRLAVPSKIISENRNSDLE